MTPTACWNSIGVRGDGTCPELARHVHCRNCRVYSDAALELLDGVPPAGYRAEWTTALAKAPARHEPDRTSVLIFRIGAEWLALSTALVQEVITPRRVHSLPHRAGGVVAGLINVRGELVVCVSLARLLGG